MSGENFISRWSRRKIDARREKREVKEEEHGARLEARNEKSAEVALQPASDEPVPLPPVESLTPESDFSPFMRDGVDPDTRRLAVKKLFADPRFNVMDGLDVYIDDYSKPDPLPEGWLEKLNQVARLGAFNPVPVQEQGADSEAERNESLQEPAGSQSEPAPNPRVQHAADPPSAPVTSNDPIDASPLGESGPGKT